MSNKNNSTYKRKNGVVMKQINLAVREDIAEKFEQLCGGLSKSAIFTQLVNEKARDQSMTLKAVNIPKEPPIYSILNGALK